MSDGEQKEVKGEDTEPKLSREERKKLKRERREKERAEGKVVKEPKVLGEKTKVILKCSKAKPDAPIIPTTGSRFDLGSARQLAFDIVLENAKAGKSVKEIRSMLANTKKANGANFSLDAAYINFVVASHPDFFELYSDGSIVILKEPVVSQDAAAAYEEEKSARKKKAEENRKKRKEEVNKGEGEVKAE